MARMDRRVAAWVIDLLGVHLRDRVLEVGFGPGVGIQLLAESASSGRVVGVDPSKCTVGVVRKVVEAVRKAPASGTHRMLKTSTQKQQQGRLIFFEARDPA
jgi:ubiquinone/menaquinone biosynthesis C-methylase UbiE